MLEITTTLVDQWKKISFKIRNSYLKNVRFRTGIPTTLHTQDVEYYRLLLETVLTTSDRHNVQTLWDVGCRNWSYVSAIASAFPNAQLHAVEVDRARRLSDFYRREDYVLAQATALADAGRTVEAHFMNFLEIELAATPNTLFCFLYPFVSTGPCHDWGLPASFAQFEKLLLHVKKQTPKNQNCKIISVHQGSWEAEIALKNYQSLNWSPKHQLINLQPYGERFAHYHEPHLFLVNI